MGTTFLFIGLKKSGNQVKQNNFLQKNGGSLPDSNHCNIDNQSDALLTDLQRQEGIRGKKLQCHLDCLTIEPPSRAHRDKVFLLSVRIT